MIWLTDRSRIEEGLHHCPYARYLKYHLDGRGIVLAAQILEPERGITIHSILADLIEAHDAPPGDVDAIIEERIEQFRDKCLATGFYQPQRKIDESDSWDNEESTVRKLDEQSSLIRGICLAWNEIEKPKLLDSFEVKAVEPEVEIVIDCTCGLGELMGSFSDHQARQCEGIALMLRPDLICMRCSDGSYGVHDYKTSKYALKQDQWSASIQMALQTLGAEHILGEDCRHYYLRGIILGADKEGKQEHPTCHAYKREASPPFQTEDWRYSWWSTDANGKRHSLQGKNYYKVPVWPEWDMRKWLALMDHHEKSTWFELVGPYERPTFLLPKLLDDIVGNERSWRELIENGLLPIKAWNCYRFFRRCEYAPICFEEQPGWEDPITMTRADNSPLYCYREPHHLAELERMKEPEMEEKEEGSNDLG